MEELEFEPHESGRITGGKGGGGQQFQPPLDPKKVMPLLSMPEQVEWTH